MHIHVAGLGEQCHESITSGNSHICLCCKLWQHFWAGGGHPAMAAAGGEEEKAAPAAAGAEEDVDSEGSVAGSAADDAASSSSIAATRKVNQEHVVISRVCLHAHAHVQHNTMVSMSDVIREFCAHGPVHVASMLCT